MIALKLITVAITLLEIRSQECTNEGAECSRDCDCCGYGTGTICIQHKEDDIPKCFRSNCVQNGDRCSDDMDCCSQHCGADGNCIVNPTQTALRGAGRWVLFDLIQSPNDIIVDGQYDPPTSMEITTVSADSFITANPLGDGVVKYVIFTTNDGTNGFGVDNDPTSYQLKGQCHQTAHWNDITGEHRITLPAERSKEKWIRIIGRPDCDLYRVMLKNSRGLPMKVSVQLKAIQQASRMIQNLVYNGITQDLTPTYYEAASTPWSVSQDTDGKFVAKGGINYFLRYDKVIGTKDFKMTLEMKIPAYGRTAASIRFFDSTGTNTNFWI